MQRLAGVVGYPVAHSLSPNIHRYWIEKCHIKNADYTLIEIIPDQFETKIRSLVEKGYVGFNVTVPYKEKIIPLLDEIDETAQKIGAVNTVIINEGKMVGYNSDAFGFIENIKAQQPDFTFRNSKVYLLGAGGAAKAIIYGLLKEGVKEVFLTNRTADRSYDLQNHFGNRINIVPWEEREQPLKESDLLVNSTVLGMDGFPALSLDLSELSKEAVVSDIVYKPLETQLLKDAKENGNRVVDGIGMLLYQALKGFSLWFGGEPSVTDELRNLILGKIV